MLSLAIFLSYMLASGLEVRTSPSHLRNLRSTGHCTPFPGLSGPCVRATLFTELPIPRNEQWLLVTRELVITPGGTMQIVLRADKDWAKKMVGSSDFEEWIKTGEGRLRFT